MEMITTIDQLSEAGFYWRELDGVRALICAPLQDDGFINGFSTRLGGVSEMPAAALSLAGFNDDAAENILENRRRFLKLFPGEWTLAGFSDQLATLDLFVKPPEWELARRWRRWAFESAALDLALRQAGRSLPAMLGREARPLRFVNSLGLGDPPEFQKFVCGKVLYNYDNLEPAERKLVL